MTNDILQPGQSYSKMYGTKPRYNEPRYNEIPDITNTIQEPKLKISPDITNKRHHATEVECVTDQHRCMQNSYHEFYFIIQIWMEIPRLDRILGGIT